MRKFATLLLLVIAGIACATPSFGGGSAGSGALPTSGGAPGSYRYDNLPDAGSHTDDALSEFRAISKWGKLELVYCFLNQTNALPDTEEHEAVRQAFAIWTSDSPLTFAESSDCQSADIEIAWFSGNHGDGDPFDGPGNVLAHAEFPNPFGPAERVILHFDDEERWMNNNSDDIDLVTVAAHEIGHNLGLGHSADPNALMFASYTGPHQFLGDDDMAGVQSLYGPPESAPPGPVIPDPDTPTPPSDTVDSDHDGLSDAAEVFMTGTDPQNADTDGDGISDGIEVFYLLNPLDADMDGDGVNDGDEVRNGTNPLVPDQPTGSYTPELAAQVSTFLSAAIEIQIEAYLQGDSLVGAQIFAGPVLQMLDDSIIALNDQGLVQVAEFDYYNSYIHDIRVLSNTQIEVDTCEIWRTSMYNRENGALVSAGEATLYPQTLHLEQLGGNWFITEVEFFEIPAFCQ